MRRRSDSSALTVDEEEWHAWRPSAVELLLLLVRLKDAVVARGVLCLVSAALALLALCLARPALWASLVGWCGDKILDNLIDGTVRRRPPSSSAPPSRRRFEDVSTVVVRRAPFVVVALAGALRGRRGGRLGGPRARRD